MFSKDDYINVGGIVTSREEMLFMMNIFSLAVDELLDSQECLIVDLQSIPYFTFNGSEDMSTKYVIYKYNGVSHIEEYYGKKEHGQKINVNKLRNDNGKKNSYYTSN